MLVNCSLFSEFRIKRLFVFMSPNDLEILIP